MCRTDDFIIFAHQIFLNGKHTKVKRPVLATFFDISSCIFWIIQGYRRCLHTGIALYLYLVCKGTKYNVKFNY